jgi:hypothetical protein
MSTTTRTFHWDALHWLRDVARLATEVRPADRVEDPTAPLHIPGFFVRPSRAGTYAYTALWMLTLGIVLVMLGGPGLTAGTKAAANGMGQLVLLTSVGLLVLAFGTSRRNRERALVELRPAAAGPATAQSVEALHREARGAIVWIVAEQAPEPAVLAAAAELGVRCLIPEGEGFVEPGPRRAK